MNKTSNFALLIVSLLCFAVVSASLFGMFFIEAAPEGPPSKLALLCGIGFWLPLISGIVLQTVLSIRTKRWSARRNLRRLGLSRTRIGLFRVFSNIPAVVSDVVLCSSFVTFISFMIVRASSILAYISLSVLFLSFCTHCIFNGKNYYYIANYEYIRDQLTKTEEK